MKVKNKREIKKDEFRTYKKTQHPTYIYAKVGNEFKYIGITHSTITRNIKNIQLDKNPNPYDNQTAYVHPYSGMDKVNMFKKKKNNWKMSNQDKSKLKKYF